MARAKAITTLILGSQGIAVTHVPITNQPINSHHSSESWHHTCVMLSELLFGLLTGHTGANLNPNPVKVCV
ncbi:MAG: hypothetical protein RLZZ04_2312 [Cyanobacteriota bacterium]|jgi:hypothetical protein